MLVGARHQEAVEAVLGEPIAQASQALRPDGRIADLSKDWNIAGSREIGSGRDARADHRLFQSVLHSKSLFFRSSGRNAVCGSSGIALAVGSRRIDGCGITSSFQMKRHPALAVQRAHVAEALADIGRRARQSRWLVEDAGEDQRAARRDRCAAMAGASRISGRARMLATIRSNGALAGEERVVEPGRGDRRRHKRGRWLSRDIVRPRLQSRPGRCRWPAPGSCASLRHGDRQHRAAGAEVERVARTFAPDQPGRSFRGSRPWCRDARCRRPGRPRSRWRCRRPGACRGHARHARRSAPARTGFSPSSERATQSISGTISSPT